MPITPEHAFKGKSTKLLILLPLRTSYNRTFQCETPCNRKSLKSRNKLNIDPIFTYSHSEIASIMSKNKKGSNYSSPNYTLIEIGDLLAKTFFNVAGLQSDIQLWFWP